MNKVAYTNLNGSVYLITLITVAAIVSMVLIGMQLRMATNSQSAIIEQMSEAGTGVLDATEYSFEIIASDSLWRIRAQTGTLFSELEFGDSVYTSTVLDADTGVTPTYDTATYRVKSVSTHQIVTRSASIDVLATEVDYDEVVAIGNALHHWALDEDSNPVLAIDSIKDKDGTYQDPTVAGAGMNDEAGLVPVFVSNNDHISVPWTGDFKQGDGSVSMWMNCTGASMFDSYSMMGMLCKLGGTPTINISVWGYGVTAYIEDDGVFSWSNWVGTGTSIITPGTWYHVAVTWGSAGMHIYIDGVEEGTNAGSTEGVKGKAGEEQPLHIGGGYSLTIPGHPEEPFEGSLSHVVYYDKQMNAAEVAEIAAVKPDLQLFTLVEDSWVRVFE